ncbi:MAG: hypothetical protein ACXWK9_07760 [Myxococcaceae bacterium]
MSNTPFYPFIPRKTRAQVTKEPDAAGRWTSQFPDMIGYGQQGGGTVPPDFHWRTNPKQDQEELTDAKLRREAEAHHALPAAIVPPALPPGKR